MDSTGTTTKRHGLRGHRDFRLLWFGDTVSQFGTQISALAIPLIAVLFLHASAGTVGVLFALEFAPFLIVGLPAGVWCDRWRRRPVMISGDLARCVLLASVTVAAWLHALTIWQLFAVVLLQGIATTFFDVAYQSYLPSLVGKAGLMEGNAKLQGSAAVAQVSGPAIAGFLIQALTAPVAVLFDAVSFLISAVSVSAIRHREPLPDRAGRRRLSRETSEGVSYVVRHPLLRSLAVATSVLNFFMAMFSAIILVFLARGLGMSPGTIGLLMSVGSVGGIVSAVTAAALTKRFGTARAIWQPLTVGCAFGLLIPLTGTGPRLLFFVVGWFGYSFAFTSYNITGVSVRQQLCPAALQGRMNATMRFLSVGLMPLGALLGGALNAWLGARSSLWVTQVGALTVPVILLLSPVRTMGDPLSHTDQATSDAAHLRLPPPGSGSNVDGQAI